MFKNLKSPFLLSVIHEIQQYSRSVTRHEKVKVTKEHARLRVTYLHLQTLNYLVKRIKQVSRNPNKMDKISSKALKTTFHLTSHTNQIH